MKYKDLILEKDSTSFSENGEKEIRKKSSEKVERVKYNIEYENDLDIAILRKTPRTEKLLVCLPSKGLFYVKSKDIITDISKDRQLAEKEIKAFFKELSGCIEGKNIKLEKNNLYNIPFLFAYSKTTKARFFNSSFSNIEIIEEIIKILFSIGVELKGRIIPRKILSNLCVALELNVKTGKTKEERYKNTINYMKKVIMYFYGKGEIQNFVNAFFTYDNYFCGEIFSIHYERINLQFRVWEYQSILNRLAIAYMVKGEHEKAFRFFKKMIESDFNKEFLETECGMKTKFDIISNDVMPDKIVEGHWSTGSDEDLESLIQTLDKIPESKEDEFWEYLSNYPKNISTCFNYQQTILGCFLRNYVMLYEKQEELFGEVPVLFMNQEFMHVLKRIYDKNYAFPFETPAEKEKLKDWLLQISKN